MLRRKLTWSLIALAALVPLALSACGGDDDVQTGAVAEVGDKPISKSEFDHWLEVVNASQQQQQAGGQRKRKQQVPRRGSPQYNQLRDQVIQFLVSASWIEGEAGDRDISTTEQEVKRQFEQTKDQSFQSEKAYQRFLKQSGQSEEDILFRVRLDVLSNKLRQEITSDSGEVTDDEIKDYFEKNKQQFSQPERRDLQVVLTKTEEQAQDALNRLKGGESFKDVVKDVSIDRASKQQDGKLLGVAQGQQEQGFDKAIFEAKKDELAGPVKTQAGYYVFKVTRITPKTEQGLEQSKEGIRQLLLSQKQQQSLDAFTQEFRRKWREQTNCQKGFVTPDCSNGEERPLTPPFGGGAGGAQPPAETGTGTAPALNGGQAPISPTGLPPGTPGVPGGAAGGGAPATTGQGMAPALGGAQAPQVPQGVPQQGAPPPQQGAPPPQQGAPPGG